jgi:hypothetical protein
MRVKDFKAVANNIYKYEFYHRGIFYSNSPNFDDFVIVEIEFSTDSYERIICTLDVVIQE